MLLIEVFPVEVIQEVKGHQQGCGIHWCQRSPAGLWGSLVSTDKSLQFPVKSRSVHSNSSSNGEQHKQGTLLMSVCVLRCVCVCEYKAPCLCKFVCLCMFSVDVLTLVNIYSVCVCMCVCIGEQ